MEVAEKKDGEDGNVIHLIVSILAIFTIAFLAGFVVWYTNKNNPEIQSIENYTYSNNTLHFKGYPFGKGMGDSPEEVVELELPQGIQFNQVDKLTYNFEQLRGFWNRDKPEIIKFFVNGELVSDSNLKLTTTYHAENDHRTATITRRFESKKE